MKINGFVVIGLLITISFALRPNQRHLLLEDWKLTVLYCPPPGSNLKNKQFNVTLPTVLHLDLLHHKQIDDPFFQNNFETLKWISDCNVKYSKIFQFSTSAKQFESVIIGFQGIDTYSSIKINDKQILFTNNSFVQYKKNIKDFLKIGANTIQVFIESTKKYDDEGQRTNRMPFQYAQTRKACYQYSWDWAPYLNTMGIWKNVYIQYYQNIKIDYVWIRNKQISQQLAVLNFAVKFDSTLNFDFKTHTYTLKIQYGGQQMFSGAIANNQQYHQINIKNPKLWWANGLGQPFIYDFTIKIISGSTIIQTKSVPYGIRSVRLDQTNNKFDVYLNGHKVYCKGANYVPPDMLYPRLTNPLYTPGNTIQNLLNDAVISNFNMIRLWGGGQYQSNQFYQMASRKGIMIFYDFMFSDSIYPSTQQFLKNVQIEFVQQIRRVRNYPCLTLWSGNNQILQGILSWGWGKPNYKQDYHKLFQIQIAQIVKNQSPYIPYIPSSPVNGVGNGGFQRGGDIHYWGVWAAGANFQAYQNAVGPFNSQFGTQSLPVWETILQFTKPQNRKYQSRQFQSHQRHGSRFNTLRKYMKIYSNTSLNFQLQTYQSGLVQAYAIQIAIKAQRSSANSSGTLYWQFNDAWPAISWSSIDYFGRWKPLQYMAKRLYEDIIAFYRPSTNKVFAINNKLYPVQCYVVVKVMSFQGEVYNTTNFTLTLRQNQIKQVTKVSNNRLQTNSHNVVIVTQIYYGNNQKQNVKISNFLKPFKNLQLPECQLNVVFSISQNQIMVTAPCLIKNLHIYHHSLYLYLTDNYFDIVPNQVYKIRLLKGQKLSDLHANIKFRGYRQSVIAGDQKIKVEVR